MRDPALVLVAELSRAIDAAHAHDSGTQAVDARIVVHILIGGALGTSIGAVEIERRRLPRCPPQAPDRPVDSAGRRERSRRRGSAGRRPCWWTQTAPAPSGLCSRIASSTFRVPRALISKSSIGQSTLEVTATCAARCSTRLGLAHELRSRGSDHARHRTTIADAVAVARLQPLRILAHAGARDDCRESRPCRRRWRSDQPDCSR